MRATFGADGAMEYVVAIFLILELSTVVFVSARALPDDAWWPTIVHHILGLMTLTFFRAKRKNCRPEMISWSYALDSGEDVRTVPT